MRLKTQAGSARLVREILLLALVLALAKILQWLIH